MMKTLRKLGAGVVAVLMMVVLVVSPVLAGEDVDKGELKDKKKSLEKKIKKTQKKLQGDKVELGQIKSTLNVVKKKVQTTAEKLSGLEREIKRRKQGIEDYRTQLEYQQQILAAVLRELYQARQGNSLAMFGSSSTRMMGSQDYLRMLQKRTIGEVDKISEIKKQLEQEKKKLGKQQDDHEQLLVEQKTQANSLTTQKVVKAREIARKEATLGQLNAKLAAVKNSLSQLLGKSISTKDIVKAASIASKRTGVRKDFILGELVVETNLGKFTGGCTYKKTRMRERDRQVFKSIAKSLGYNYKKLKVSCAASWGGYGGAMGVAQFMPTTWQGYAARVAAATGNNPADPWDLVDGVTAMALFLKDKGAGSKKGEFVASKRYFCGSSRSYYWNTRCNKYAQDVQYWAKNYERLLK